MGDAVWHGNVFYIEPSGHIVCCQKEGYNVRVSAVMRYFFDQDINVIILSNVANDAWIPRGRYPSSSWKCVNDWSLDN